MIHYSCDCCKQIIDPREGLRYIVRMEVYAAMEPTDVEDEDGDNDHLAEIQDILECMDDSDSDRIGDDVYQQMRFDLCPGCRKKFVRNPIEREPSTQLNFSDN